MYNYIGKSKSRKGGIYLLGKTHFMVGTAASLLLTQPRSAGELMLAFGVGGIGALIPDIDVDTSGSHKYADKLVAASVVIIAALFAAEKLFSAGIINSITSDSSCARIAIGLILCIAICAFGKQQPHRSFMHSILALVLLTGTVGLIWEDLIPYFAIGFASHIITDLFNFKKVKLLYPLKGGVAFKLFHAHGLANTVFFTVGGVLTAAELIIFSARIFLSA